MATETVILTALPNGIAHDGRLRVTVFVSPRLLTDGAASLKLRQFAAFRDWPAALGNVKFAVEFDGVGTADAVHDDDSPEPSSDTWNLLFDENTVGVLAGKGEFPDLSDRTVRSFPASTVAGYILGLYNTVASTSGTNFPSLTMGPMADFARTLGRLNEGKDFPNYDQLDDIIAEERGPDGKHGRYLNRAFIPAGQEVAYGFLQAYRYYDRGSADPVGPERVPAPPEVPEFDFHGYVSSLGDYRELLRHLGLAIDLRVEAPNPPPVGMIRLQVEVDTSSQPDMSFTANEEARPWTHYVFHKKRFVPRPHDADPDLLDGMLRLDLEKDKKRDTFLFDVHQIDVDGSAMKTVDFAANAWRMLHHQVIQGKDTMRPPDAALPALRTGGFVVTRQQRDAQVVKQFDAAAQHEQETRSGVPTELWARDVTRGYRVDVQDVDTGRWFSLYDRTGSYVVRRDGVDTRVPDLEPDDEGYAKGSSTTSTKTSTPKDDELYLHEALFGWDGWSMVAKRPGQPIAKDDASIDDDAPLADFPLITSFEPADGSLPRQRFGRSYRFRARAVDMAANSIDKDRIDKALVTRPHMFLRYDPVPSPAVVPRRRFTEGESLLRMVIRSTLGKLPDDYVAWDEIVHLVGHTTEDTKYLVENDRHLAPPKTAVQLAEWHGMFDDALKFGAAQADVNFQFDIAAGEAGSYIDAAPRAFVVNPDPNATPTDLTQHTKGDPLQQGEYVCHGAEQLHLPYLPDVLSAGAAFTSLPGDPNGTGKTWPQPWDGGDWPERFPFLLRIADGGLTDDPQRELHFDEDTRLLTVYLRQADMVTVRLSSVPTSIPDALGVLGIWQLVESPSASLKTAAAEGRHWMLTPYQELTLVHAVEKPLREPVINVTDAGVRRYKGETFAWFDGSIDNHAKSTGRIDIDATWTADRDDVTRPAPDTETGFAHVADFQLLATEDACKVGRDDGPLVHKVRHEFHDTKHRQVTYTPTATTRFREYFPTEITDQPARITNVGPERHLRVRSSRRPDPPDVMYVVPTFTWEDVPTVPTMLVARGAKRANRMVRRRRAGARVYLKRPWYSSGDGELLGVVVPDQPYFWWRDDMLRGLRVDTMSRLKAEEIATQLLQRGEVAARPRGPQSLSLSEQVLKTFSADALVSELVDLSALFLYSGDPEKFVTRWGSDPMWGSDNPASGPWINQFPLRVDVGTGLSLSELRGYTVAVVGHKPEYDYDRQVWYCDIDIDAGTSYFPFVRFGLARYQPHSIDDCHLSRVVTPEWAQLPAERTATVTQVEPHQYRIQLRGPAGYTEAAADLVGIEADMDGHRMQLSRFAFAQVERLPVGARSDLDWVPVGRGTHMSPTIARTYSDVRYTGGISVPKRKRGERMRLAIREYEMLETDLSQNDRVLFNDKIVGFKPVGPPDDPDIAPVDKPVSKPVRYRVVYADTFDV
jgi:hypothetical protein